MSNKPWLQNYPPGVPSNVNTKAYNTLTELFDDVFKKYNTQDAFTCMGKSISFKELDIESNNFAAYLHSRGLVHGDKIALMMPNLLQYPIALFGALRAGLVVVNTNPLYTPPEMKHQFIDSEVSAIVIADNFASNLEKILSDTNIKTIITTSIGEYLSPIKGKIVDFVVKKVKKMVPKYTLPNVVSFKDTLKVGKKFTITPFEGNPEDVIIHQYTGGTTGVAKGAMLTNSNLIATMMQIKALFEPSLNQDKKVIALSPLPLYHIFAFSVNGLALMSLGANNILVTNPRDLKSVFKEFKKNKINLMTGVNTLFNSMLNHKDFSSLDFSGMRITVGGGMAVQDSVAIKWKEVTGCYLSQGYGLTETCAILSVNPFTEELGRLGTIGLPFPNTDIKIVDDGGIEVPIGERGELVAKGPQVMKGYYKKVEETTAAIQDGWFKTGDIATMDEDGFFKIVDRKKDMILVSGFNVFPNEIEDTLSKHEKILESAVIGIPSDRSGEVVKAFIVKKDKSLTEKEVIQFCRENMTGYKVPKHVEFRKELPKSNVGKILRRLLKE